MKKQHGFSLMFSKAPKEVHNDLVVSRHETMVALDSLRTLTDKDLIAMRSSLISRLESVEYWLNKYVSVDDELFEDLK